MKKALFVLAGLFVLLIVVPVIAGAIGQEAINAMATVYTAAVFALPFVLVFLLGRHLRKRKNAASESKPAAQEAAPQPSKPVVTIAKVEKVPPVTPAAPDDIKGDASAGNGIAYHYNNVGIFVPFLDVLERPDVVPGAIVTFRQEPENRFDSRAVAVVIGRKRIGYLFRSKLQDMANDWIERGDTVSGRIVRVSPEVPDAKNHAIAIDLYFYE